MYSYFSVTYSTKKMGGFWDDVSDGYQYAYNNGVKPAYNLVKKNYNRLDNVADAANGAATNLLDILGGNSNVLVYLAIGIVAIVVVPKLIEKAL